MLTRSQTITKLQNFHDAFTRDNDLRDGENKGKPHETLDTFVDFDMVDAALHYLIKDWASQLAEDSIKAERDELLKGVVELTNFEKIKSLAQAVIDAAAYARLPADRRLHRALDPNTVIELCELSETFKCELCGHSEKCCAGCGNL